MNAWKFGFSVRLKSCGAWPLFAAVAALSFWPVMLRSGLEASPMNQLKLPEQVREWSRAELPERITATTIFDYMNGAGELYLAYRFLGLDVYRYVDAEDEEILVEIYHMQNPEDAFGLLSLDWGGQRIDPARPDAAAVEGEPSEALFPARALYGAGLLRMVSGSSYVRIMAYRESGASRQAILEIARLIDSGQPRAAPPRLLTALPAAGPSGFIRQPGRFSYFRSHLVLNSVYFLSLKNILGLSKEAEAVIASYRSPRFEGALRLVVIRYPDRASAEHGLREFQSAYLPTEDPEADQPPLSGKAVVRAIEDGWAGFIDRGRNAALIFESPDEATARLFLEECKEAMANLEAYHE
jgi:hypothetical protein